MIFFQCDVAAEAKALGQFQEDEHSEVFCQKHYLANHFLIQLRKEVLANFFRTRINGIFCSDAAENTSWVLPLVILSPFLRKMGLNSADVLQYYLLNVACHITFFLGICEQRGFLPRNQGRVLFPGSAGEKAKMELSRHKKKLEHCHHNLMDRIER